VSILETFARKASQLEVIILSPKMRQNSPTDAKFSQGKNPQTPLKGGRVDWGGESGREGELANPNVKL